MAHVPVSDRRRQFIDAAIRVIAREGVARATTRRIAEDANAPASILHYCFSSKDELFQAVFDQGPLDGRAAGSRDVVPGMGLAAGVDAIVRGYLGWIVEDRELQQAQFELIFWAMRTPTAQHLPGRVYRDYANSVVQLLDMARRPEESDVDLNALARQIIALIDGHVLQSMSMGENDLKAMVEQGSANIRDAIRPEAPAISS